MEAATVALSTAAGLEAVAAGELTAEVLKMTAENLLTGEMVSSGGCLVPTMTAVEEGFFSVLVERKVEGLGC